jgi:hypothetical protein
MSTSLPAEIGVRELPGGVYYRLPRRRFGCAAAVGLVVALFGAFFAAGGAGALLAAVAFGRKESLLAGVLIGLIGVPIVLLGLFLALGGLWLTFGHTEIRLADGRLSSILKIGPLLYFVRRRNLADLRRLVLASDADKKSPVLVAACAGPRPMELATLYPYDWLWHLGEDLALRCRVSRGDEPGALEVEEEWTDFTGERPEQPALSRVVVEEAAEGPVFRVPAAGWRDAGPLALGTVAAIFAAFGLALLLLLPAEGKAVVLLVGLLPALGMFLGSVVLARRHVVFEVRGDTLVLTRTGLFTRTRSWSRDEVDAIRAVRELRKQTSTDEEGNTNTTWVWVVELQIHAADRRPVVLSGRYGMIGRAIEQEWEWLATALREALEVPA